VIERVINFSIRYRWLVLLGAFGLAGLGAYEFEQLPIDAVPDITNVQVQINTAAYGLSTPEIEQQITYPIETAMAGLPSLESTRSLSYYGLSQVTVVFKEGADIYLARMTPDQSSARLPQVLAKSICGQSMPNQEPKSLMDLPTR
jgi:cobalt-zinc-cadmium resistance protein CzcA